MDPDTSPYGLIKNSEYDVIDYQAGEENKKILDGYSSYLDIEIKKEEEVLGTTRIYYTDEFLKKDLKAVLVQIVLKTLILTLILTGTTFLLLISLVQRPLQAITSRIREIAKGEGDLTNEIVIKRKDEIGDLADNFNLFVKKLRDTEISSTTVELSSGGRQITEAMMLLTSVSDKVQEAAVSMSLNADSVLTEVDTVSRISTEVAGGMEEIGIGTNEVSKAVNDIKDLSIQLESASSILDKEVNKFKTE